MVTDFERFIFDILQNLLPLILAFLSAFVAILVYLRKGKLKLGNISIDFGAGGVEVEARRLRKAFTQQAVDKNVDKQYILLSEYHAQGLAQSRVSFWFSLVFASIGFAVIMTAILTADKSVQITQQGPAFITLVAGTVIDAVSGLFFIQSNKARELMIAFFDKLRTDRKLDEALSLASQINDEVLQSRLRILLALNFADVSSTDALPLILGVEKPNISGSTRDRK